MSGPPSSTTPWSAGCSVSAAADVSQLLDTDLLELVNSVRITDDLDRGPDAFEPSVTEQLVDRLGSGLRRATGRLAVPYALARAKVIADASAQQPAGPPDGRVPPQVDPESAGPDSAAVGRLRRSDHDRARGRRGVDERAVRQFRRGRVRNGVRPPAGRRPAAGDAGAGARRRRLEAGPGSLAGRCDRRRCRQRVVRQSGERPSRGRPGRPYSFSFPPGGHLVEPYDSEWTDHIELDEGAARST